MSSNHRLYTALIRPNSGMKETLPPRSKIERRGIEYVFLRIIQDGLDRGKIVVAKENNGLITLTEHLYPSEFGCEVVY